MPNPPTPRSTDQTVKVGQVWRWRHDGKHYRVKEKRLIGAYDEWTMTGNDPDDDGPDFPCTRVFFDNCDLVESPS